MSLWINKIAFLLYLHICVHLSQNSNAWWWSHKLLKNKLFSNSNKKKRDIVSILLHSSVQWSCFFSQIPQPIAWYYNSSLLMCFPSYNASWFQKLEKLLISSSLLCLLYKLLVESWQVSLVINQVSFTEIVVKMCCSLTACTQSSIVAQLMAQLTPSTWLRCEKLCLNLTPQILQV